jgi:uncharacterized protein YfiM (DUF2279 family)
VTFVGANAGLYEYFRRAWWSGERADFRIDWERQSYFRQADKLGHMYGGYYLTVGGRELLEAACYPEKKAAVLGAVYAAAFQLQIEVWDGFQARYGFSPPDLIANTAGAGLALTQSFVPVARAIKPTVSYRRTRALRNVDNFPPGHRATSCAPRWTTRARRTGSPPTWTPSSPRTHGATGRGSCASPSAVR